MARKKPIISPLGQWAYPGEVTVIPSSKITMKGVNYPVLGIDDLGNQQMMMPGGEYTFPGNYVTEYPQMQFGGMSKRKVNKILNENKDLNFVQRMYQPNTPSIMIPGQQHPSTHFMESGDGRVYPTVVQMPDGTLQYLGDNAYDYANQTGQYIEFPNDRQARRFAKSYKKGTGVLEEFGKGGWLNKYQTGGTLPPIYTSNPNDPRLQRFNDSASLHNSNFFIPNKDVFYRSNAELKKSFCKDINCYGLVRDGVKQNKKQKLEYIKGIQPTGYDNFPNKSDYNKGLSTEILFPEPVQPIIYQPSLAVSNIDRDMYTPGGGMAREYNIGVTLQDGNRKSFRTEKEYQDWKAANNLDISKAKVTEGRGYSYNYYPENKKYGGWLNKYQVGGSETTTFLNPDRMGEVSIKANKNNKNNFLNVINNKLNKFLGKDQDLNFNNLLNNKYVGPLEDSWNWTKQYMSSPRYKEMLESKDPDNSIQINRAHNLFTIPNELYNDDSLELSGKAGSSNGIDGAISVVPDYDNSVLSHEISHSVDRPKFYKWDEDYYLLGDDRQIPIADQVQIKKRIKNNPDLSFTIPFWEDYGSTPEEGTLNYFTDPTEVRARLNEFRHQLYLKHLESPGSFRGVDIFNEPVKKEKLDNISIPDDFNRYYNDDDFLWLLNNVSKTEQPKLNIAKYGGWLNKYQTGGWDNWTPNTGKPKLKQGGAIGWLDIYQDAGEVPLGKSVEEYTNQFNEEISSLKDWYEANRKRIGDAVPEAYLRNDLKNAKKEYGPQPDPENYNPAVSDWEYDNPRVTGVRSKYNPVTNTFNERYIPPAFPFNFPELKIGLDNSKNTEESAIGIPNSYTYTNSRVKNNSFVVPYSSDYNKQLKNKGYIKDQKISVDPTAIDLYTGKNDPSTIMSHETSHYLNKNNPEVFLFNRTKLAEMGITDTEGFNNYYSTILNNDRKEDELLSDAYALKQDMRKKGFYDYTKGEKLTPKIWNKYKKEYPDNFIIDRFTPVFENQGKNNIEELYNRNNSTEGINNIETLNDNYNITDPFSPHLKNTKETPTFKTFDERIIHLLNEIVKNKDQDLNIAKYGGWLSKYQTAGEWAGWTPNVGKPYMRTSPAGNAGYSDNTRVSGPDLNNRKAAEAAQYARKVGSISQGTRKSDYEKAREASSFVSQAERRKGSADPLDYVLDMVNPASLAFAGSDLIGNTGSAVSNAAQGNFAEAGTDLLGAGLNALQIIPAAAEFKGFAKPYLYNLINKNPKLSLSLQRGRPVNLDNVNSISGIKYGDAPPYSNTVSENSFFKQLEKGAGSLDNSLQRRISDLESKEGFRRLVKQEQNYLLDNTDMPLDMAERVSKLNAKARIEELKNTTNINKQAAEYASINNLDEGLPNKFVLDPHLYDNAYYSAGIKNLNLVEPIPSYSKSIPGEIAMGYNFVGSVPTEMHEIGHALQRGRKLSLDDGLKNIVPKKSLNPTDKAMYNYFNYGSQGSEPTAFANELRESMFQKGFIPDYYTPINQKQIQDAYKYFKKNPIGIYDKNTGKFVSSTRIFDFMDPSKANSKFLANALNDLPAVVPLAVGAATASQLQEQKNGGWLNKYQEGGENLPELNSKIDIANFYKNPLSEKYGIYQDPEDDTYKYYLKTKEAVQPEEEYRQLPDLSNIDKQKLKEINAKKASLSEIQLSNIQPVSPVILPKQRDQILRDKLYYEQDDLMEQAISEFPIPSVKTPTYSEMLDADPEFKRVMTEKPKLVAPIKPKPVATNTPLVPIANAPRAIVRPAVRKVVAKNDIVNLADLTITKADKAYLNKVDEYCPGGNCLETTRNAYDMLPGRIQGILTSSDIWSKDLNVHSKKGTPTADDIKKYPYFAGDSGSGTLDSWDAHGRIVETGGKNFYNINTPTPINYKEIPVGALIGWGPANKKDSNHSSRNQGYNKKFGMQPSHHSTMVVGYSEDGEPIVYDGFLEKYMTLTEAKANIGSRLDYELENISAPKSVLNNTQDNLRSQGVLLNYIPPTNVNPNKILAAANQPWAKVEGHNPRFNKEMMVEFNSALMNNKGELMRNLNMSSEKYDELSKILLAIQAQESEGGGGLRFIDHKTIGMTQLNPDNIYDNEKLAKIASKPYMLNDGNNNILSPSLIQKSPSASAVASMIYISQLEKDAQAKYAEGKKPQERKFEKNSNIAIDLVRSNTSRYNSDGFFVEEANKRIDLSPFEGGILSSADPVAAQKLLNKTAGNNKYRAEVNADGDLVIIHKTKGNADLTLPEIIGYGWQSLNTLKYGDAQGDSVHNKRIKNYYDLLNNTTPTYRKEGGQTSWLNKYK